MSKRLRSQGGELLAGGVKPHREFAQRGMSMAGPSKVQFPGQKKQRMRARGTKRPSAGVLKRLEKNLSELLDEPHAMMPVVAYTVKRARKDPVQRSLKECAKVIAKAFH